PTAVPCAILNDTWSTATMPPNRLDTPASWRIGEDVISSGTPAARSVPNGLLSGVDELAGLIERSHDHGLVAGLILRDDLSDRHRPTGVQGGKPETPARAGYRMLLVDRGEAIADCGPIGNEIAGEICATHGLEQHQRPVVGLHGVKWRIEPPTRLVA